MVKPSVGQLPPGMTTEVNIRLWSAPNPPSVNNDVFKLKTMFLQPDQLLQPALKSGVFTRVYRLKLCFPPCPMEPLVMARDDDVIKVAGHKVSSSAIEEVLLRHPLVADAAVMGVADKLNGQVPLGLVIPKQGDVSNLEEELVQLVRTDLGAVAAFRLVAKVTGLPRTRSGETARKTIADLADGKKVKIPPTIEDPSVYAGVKSALQSLGYAVDAPDPELRGSLGGDGDHHDPTGQVAPHEHHSSGAAQDPNHPLVQGATPATPSPPRLSQLLRDISTSPPNQTVSSHNKVCYESSSLLSNTLILFPVK